VGIPQSVRPFLLFAFLLGVFALSSLLAPRDATMEFFRTTAQVIPVLVLVLLLEMRLFDLRALVGADIAKHQFMGAWASLYALMILGFLLAAEFVALHPLSTGKAADGSADFVYGALATGFVAVAILGLLGGSTLGATPAKSRDERDRR